MDSLIVYLFHQEIFADAQDNSALEEVEHDFCLHVFESLKCGRGIRVYVS